MSGPSETGRFEAITLAIDVLALMNAHKTIMKKMKAGGGILEKTWEQWSDLDQRRRTITKGLAGSYAARPRCRILHNIWNCSERLCSVEFALPRDRFSKD